MKKILKAIGNFFISFLGDAKKFEQFLTGHVDEAITVVSNLKRAVENPVILTLIMILPEKYRNAAGDALARVEGILTAVLTDLAISNSCLQKPTLGEKLRCLVESLKAMSPAMQEAVYHKFAALYTKYSSGQAMPSAYFDTAVQDRFFVQKEAITV